jgi:hypothetical protein
MKKLQGFAQYKLKPCKYKNFLINHYTDNFQLKMSLMVQPSCSNLTGFKNLLGLKCLFINFCV